MDTGNLPLGVKGSKALNPENFAKYLGLASWLMTMSKDHKELSLSTLDQRILPAILLKQFRLFKNGEMPIAFVTWAMVSDDVLKRISVTGEQPKLIEWRSGENLVVVDCVSPFGPADKIKSEFLKSMS